MISIIEAIRERELLNDSLSPAQTTALKSLYGLALTAEELAIYREATTNEEYLPREYRECMLICGRRSGKSSRIAANCAIYEACLRPHELSVGERGWCIVLAATKRQAGVVYGYIRARIEQSPVLRRMLADEPREDTLDLTNGISIGVWACNFRSIRGLSIVACIADEVAFWYDDASAANPAGEIFRAARPGMSSFFSAKLVKISSPFAKSGVVWTDWKDRAAHPEMLCWKLGTRQMNPALDPKFLDEEERRDSESFQREYNAQFYESASAFLPADAIESCIVPGRIELPPTSSTAYCAALDVAFKADYFAFGLVHRVGDRVVQDFVRSWRGSKSSPVNLSQVLAEIVLTLKAYNCWEIFGDSFCSEPVRQALKGQGVTFEQATTLGTRAAPIWSTLRTLITSKQIELLDEPQTITELKRLELIVTSGGNQRVEGTGTTHDDRAVVLALASHQAISQGVAGEPWAEVMMGLPDQGPSVSRPNSDVLGGGLGRHGDVEIDADGFSWHRI